MRFRYGFPGAKTFQNLRETGPRSHCPAGQVNCAFGQVKHKVWWYSGQVQLTLVVLLADKALCAYCASNIVVEATALHFICDIISELPKSTGIQIGSQRPYEHDYQP